MNIYGSNITEFKMLWITCIVAVLAGVSTDNEDKPINTTEGECFYYKECSYSVSCIYPPCFVSPRCNPKVYYCLDEPNCEANITRQECNNIRYSNFCKSEDIFDCGDGRCIHKAMLCDGRKDCENGADELNCTIACSDIRSFDCTDGTCILHPLICDGISHCGNNFDEEECDFDIMNKCLAHVDESEKCCVSSRIRKLSKKSCLYIMNEAQCLEENGKHITIANEKMQQIVSQFYSSFYGPHGNTVKIGLNKLTGTQVHSDYRWADGSPLTYTHWNTSQNPDKRCFALGPYKDGMSVWKNISCTSRTNMFCHWTSEKAIKVSLEKPVGNLTLEKSNNSFECDSGEFISLLYVCDLIDDCADKSDEYECDISFNIGTYKCNDGTPVNIGQWCDFSKDCLDGSDEMYCSATPCNGYEWRCDSGQCIPLETVCDNKHDCLDDSDESIAACYAKCEEKDLFTCSDCEYQKCLQRSLSADDNIDCQEGADKPMDVLPVCPDNLNGSKYYRIDLGNEIYGPLDVYCDSSRVVLEATSVTSYFSTYYNMTVVMIRYGSDQLADRLVELYDSCIQELHGGNTWTSFSFSHTRYLGANLLVWNNNGLYTIYCLSGVLCYTTDATTFAPLPFRTILFTYLEDPASLKPRLICNSPRLKQHGELMALDTMTCKTTGTKIYARNRCLLNIKPTGAPFGCRDLTHLENCEEFICPIDYVKCPKKFCLHARLVCDGKPHCPNKEDEFNCDKYACIGMYRCRRSRGCLPGNMLCDGIRQCPLGDDENMCNFVCPKSCKCQGVSLKCNDEIKSENNQMATYVRYLDLENVLLSKNGVDGLSFFINLIVLKLSGCGLKTITVENSINSSPFNEILNLQILDLSNNELVSIPRDAFVGLQNLRKLILTGNKKLTFIMDGAFNGLEKVTHAYIAHTNVTSLNNNTLAGMKRLKHLDLSFNHLLINDATFQDTPYLTYLDVQGNNIAPSEEILSGISNLEVMYTDASIMCCFMKAKFMDSTCLAPEDSISSCDDLIKNEFLRICIWIIGGSALIGNIFVVGYRAKTDFRQNFKSHSFFITLLGISDLLMGVYTILIACIDIKYRGSYIKHDFEWRRSSLCTFAGVLSTISSEMSAFLICLIAVDRFIAIKFPFSIPSKRFDIILALSAALFSISIAIMPLLFEDYFNGEFYSRSGVCIALPLTSDGTPGWEYSVGVFIVLNMIIFVTVGVVQALIYKEVKSSSAIRLMGKQANVEVLLAKSLTAVILTDFCCWFPVVVLGFMALGGTEIDSEVYAWVVVFVLPVNSALNPFLYTLSAIRNKKTTYQQADDIIDMATANEFLQIHNKISSRQRQATPSTENNISIKLSDLVSSGGVTMENLESIKSLLISELEFYHAKNFFHGHISEDTITVVLNGNDVVDAFLEFQHKKLTKGMSKQNDLQILKALAKRLRHSLKVKYRDVCEQNVGENR